jgi:uncharacterized protein
MNATELRTELRAALKSALRARDRTSTQALRSAIAAIDNAEAVPTTARAGAIEAAVGRGATEAERRQLTERELRAILQAEVNERHAAAEECAAAAPATAERLRSEAAVIAAYTSDVV